MSSSGIFTVFKCPQNRAIWDKELQKKCLLKVSVAWLIPQILIDYPESTTVQLHFWILNPLFSIIQPHFSLIHPQFSILHSSAPIFGKNVGYLTKNVLKIAGFSTKFLANFIKHSKLVFGMEALSNETSSTSWLVSQQPKKKLL